MPVDGGKAGKEKDTGNLFVNGHNGHAGLVGCAGTVTCYFVFVLVRMYHTVSTTAHTRAEPMNPT
jgi:hypothetical protein